MHELGAAGSSGVIESDPGKLRILFNEMIQMCLWYFHFFSNIKTITNPSQSGEMPPSVTQAYSISAFVPSRTYSLV